jgi:CRISPR-associated protein Cas2
MEEHLYIVTYDIEDQKRWRRVFKLMHGYGEWLQLSVFQCRMSRKRYMQLMGQLDGLIVDDKDHVIMLDIGPAEGIAPRVISLGKTFKPIEREVVVV